MTPLRLCSAPFFRAAAPSLAIVALLGAVACSGSDGDPCQESDDCNSGLLCCKPSMTLSARGVCQAVCTDLPGTDAGPAVPDGGLPDGGAADGGSSEDAGSPSDGGADAGASPDAGALPDAGSDGGVAPDAGPPDSGPPDSGPPDSGPAPDAGA